MKKLLASLLAVSMVLALASCGSKPQEPSNNGGTSTPNSNSSASTSTPPAGNDSEKTVEGKTVAFIPKLTGNAFFEVANTGAQEYAKDWGMTVDYIGSPPTPPPLTRCPSSTTPWPRAWTPSASPLWTPPVWPTP